MQDLVLIFKNSKLKFKTVQNNVKEEHIGVNSSFSIDEGDATAWAETCNIILHQDDQVRLDLNGERPEQHSRNESSQGSLSDGLIQVSLYF